VLTREVKPVKTDAWRRLTGLSTVRGARNLAVARELWLARDALAREIDTSPGRLVPDSSLVAAARSLPDSKRDLAALREFNGRASRSELGRWWEAIEAGKASTDQPPLHVASEAVPPARVWSDRNPQADKRLKISKAAIAEVSVLLDVPVENLLLPETLRRLAWEPPAALELPALQEAMRELGVRQWQIDATAQVILNAFVDASQNSVEPAHGES
jgi:ribonuclease D